MGKVIITRKGGAIGTKAPSINFVSKTESEIVFTITNNDTATADIFWEVSDSTPEANQLSLAGETTSGNITASGLTAGTQYTIFVFANAANKAGSDTVSLTQTTTAITYIDATGGTTTTYQDGSKFYKSHTFTSSGNLVVNSLSNQSALNEVDYLIIAGGGSGGASSGGLNGGCGGGAGGYRTTNGTSGENSSAESKVTINAQTYGITIGAGAAGGFTNNEKGTNGSNSSALGITSTGGGGGANEGDVVGNVGGSGGGSMGSQGPANGITGQGFAGGNNNATRGTGGGGGAGQAGELFASTSRQGNGGDGLGNILRNGTTEFRAGGGAGGSSGNFTTTGGTGGLGGGGNESQDGAVNTGSGGGGGDNRNRNPAPSGAGGSGIVIIRYEVESL